MRRFLKIVVLLAIVGGALGLLSYVGARAAAGKILGPNQPVGDRSAEFAWGGVASLPDRPRAWVFTYHSSQLPGVASAQIVVSPTGEVLAMQPADLDLRVEAWERTRLP